jgi:Na+/H+ antiporter NhaB
MDIDGSNKQRISFMNVKNHAQSANHYRLAGCLSFISDNSFLGGVMTKPLGLTGRTVKVVFKTKQ